MIRSTAPATRRRSEGGFLLGIFVGVVIGLTVALGIAFYLNKTPIPFLAANKAKSEAEKAPAGKGTSIARLPQGSSAPAPSPEKAEFDFYRILPGSEETVTEKEIRERTRAAAKGQQDGPKDVY